MSWRPEASTEDDAQQHGWVYLQYLGVYCSCPVSDVSDYVRSTHHRHIHMHMRGINCECKDNPFPIHLFVPINDVARPGKVIPRWASRSIVMGDDAQVR